MNKEQKKQAKLEKKKINQDIKAKKLKEKEALSQKKLDEKQKIWKAKEQKKQKKLDEKNLKFVKVIEKKQVKKQKYIESTKDKKIKKHLNIFIFDISIFYSKMQKNFMKNFWMSILFILISASLVLLALSLTSAFIKWSLWLSIILFISYLVCSFTTCFVLYQNSNTLIKTKKSKQDKKECDDSKTNQGKK